MGYVRFREGIYIYLYFPLACSNSDFRTSSCFCKASSKFEPGVAAPAAKTQGAPINSWLNRHQCFTGLPAHTLESKEYVHQQKCREESVESWWVEHPFKKNNFSILHHPHTKKNKNTPQNHHLAIQCLPRAFTRSPTNTPPKRVSFRSKMSTFRGAFTAWPAFHAAVPPVPSRHQDAARRLTFRTDQVARRRRIHGEAPRLGGNPRFQTPETVWGVCVCVCGFQCIWKKWLCFNS